MYAAQFSTSVGCRSWNARVQESSSQTSQIVRSPKVTFSGLPANFCLNAYASMPRPPVTRMRSKTLVMVAFG